MKKIVIALSALMIAMAMTACGGKTEDTAETTAAETTVSETTVADTVAESEETSAEVSETEAEAEATETEATESETESVSDAETDATESEAAENEEAATVNPLTDIANAVIAEGEWPAMMEMTDEAMLKDYYLLDPANENYQAMIVMMCPMSANMCEVIIVKATDVAAAEEDLNARREKALTMDAFYPDDVTKAENSIVGSSGEYAYFLMCGDSAKAEEALLAAIG